MQWVLIVFNWETQVQYFADEAEARAAYDSQRGTHYATLARLVETTDPHVSGGVL